MKTANTLFTNQALWTLSLSREVALGQSLPMPKAGFFFYTTGELLG